jgi:hypothetical protein
MNVVASSSTWYDFIYNFECHIIKLGFVEGILESGLVTYASANGEYGSVLFSNLAFGTDGSVWN